MITPPFSFYRIAILSFIFSACFLPSADQPQPPLIPPSSERTDVDKANAALNDHVLYYGIVQDQDGNPLENVEIKIDIGGGNPIQGPIFGGVTSTTTDKDGRFSIDGGRGGHLHLVMNKAGYAQVIENASYLPMDPQTYHHADPSKPTVIEMWKWQGGQPLVKISRTFTPDYTGKPIILDLTHGIIVDDEEIGDLVIMIDRPQDPTLGPKAFDGSLKDFPWGYSIHAVHGQVGKYDRLLHNVELPGIGSASQVQFVTEIRRAYELQKQYEGIARVDLVFSSRNKLVWGALLVFISPSKEGRYDDMSHYKKVSITIQGLVNTHGKAIFEIDKNHLTEISDRK